jgi:phosphoribosylformylglycinamidine cyclo-ligase
VTTYRRAGVDLEGADRHVASIASVVTATWNDRVVGGFGGFAAGLTLPAGYVEPVLMLTTDGVGTKLELARRFNRWAGVGFDLVAMVVDDLAAAGAIPLGIVDYMAVGALDPQRDTAIVASIAAACSLAGCALLGGETAEHPGVMEPEQIDLAATALGVVEKGGELGAHRVGAGDVLIGLTSPNLRSNGFSLVRAVIGNRDLQEVVEGRPLIDWLMEASVIYSPAVLKAVATGRVHAAAHITGGGLLANLARVIPDGHEARVDFDAWQPPRVFEMVAAWGDLPPGELHGVLNMGIGFCLITAPEDADTVIGLSGHEARVIGTVAAV